MNISFITASNNEEVLAKNFLSSDIVKKYPTIVMFGYKNVQKAYNDAMKSATGDILCFVHQDVFLPPFFEGSLLESLKALENEDWGVIGPAGRTATGYLGHIVDRGMPWGSPHGLPTEVQTLDELMLIIKKDTFKFDDNMPNYHLFGTDLCLQSSESGKKNFAINTLCHHNSNHGYTLPKEFYLGAHYLANKWKHRLPIYTTCIIIK
jgi:hypothetical protein